MGIERPATRARRAEATARRNDPNLPVTVSETPADLALLTPTASAWPPCPRKRGVGGYLTPEMALRAAVGAGYLEATPGIVETLAVSPAWRAR